VLSGSSEEASAVDLLRGTANIRSRAMCSGAKRPYHISCRDRTVLVRPKACTVQDIEAMHNSVAARVPSDLQQHGALIPRPKTPDGAKRGSSSALACFGGGKVLAPACRFLPSLYAVASHQPTAQNVTVRSRRKT